MYFYTKHKKGRGNQHRMQIDYCRDQATLIRPIDKIDS